MRKMTALFTAIVFVLLLLAAPVYASDIVVNENCSLIDAIKAANRDQAVKGCPAGEGADTITLSANTGLQWDPPKITSDMTVDGKGYTIHGNNRFRIFYIEAGNTVAIHNLTMTRSMARYKGHLIMEEDDAFGGAIYNEGTLTISDSSFIHNVADEYGGAIHNEGTLTISNSSFIDNRAVALGGAISNYDGTLVISDSRFSGNTSEDGGAILNSLGGRLAISGSSFNNNAASVGGAVSNKAAAVTISGSSFIDNRAKGIGGAVHNWFGKMSISSSSFSGNSADYRGGAVYVDGNYPAALTHLTLANNTANQGGGIYMGASAEVNLYNSIIAGGDCFGELNDNIGNLIEDGSCSPAFSGDPMLGARVEPEDGSTAHYPLMVDSPAIDAANEKYCPDTDQVGTERPQENACAIGAIEYTTTIEPEDTIIIISTTSLNVRRGPNAAYGVVDGLRRGEEAAAIGRDADGAWVQVNTGWIFAQMIETKGSIMALPVTSG